MKTKNIQIKKDRDLRINEFTSILSELNNSPSQNNIPSQAELSKLITKINSLQKKHLNLALSHKYDICPNIIPYDNEVMLMYGLDSYVNASFVKIGNINFIAASYPKPKYQNQFFELLRKSETSLIVSFHTDSDDYFKDCEIISDMGENEVYDAKIYEVGDLHVKRLLMKTWNDFNVPIRSELEEFYVFFTENLPMDREINVLVHCYAGVGRTGTFILYHALRKMKNITVNDVLEMFVVLRAHRPYLVYNTAQLEFVLNCFISKEQ